MIRKKMSKTAKTVISLTPIVVLVVMLAVSIGFFGADAISGASQVCLFSAAIVCAALGMLVLKKPWADFEKAIKENIGDITQAIIILFLIGAISGSWTMSGTIPSLIYYGVHIIHPRIFLLSACVICAVVSLMTGSSWTTIATIGVALMGIGKAQGFSDGLIAGAIISGAYFGDKNSPISETTVMASSVAGTPLFTHIRYMMYTTVPSFTICLVLFTILGLTTSTADTAQISLYSDALSAKFHISPWTLIVPAITAYMIAKRLDALIVLSVSALLATISALILQPHIVSEIGKETLTMFGQDGGRGAELFSGSVRMIYDEVSVSTGVADVDALTSTKGMTGMLNTVFLIITTMCFGGCLKGSGMLQHLSSLIIPLARKRVSMVATTVCTGLGLNIVVSDQYLSIILTSEMFKKVYADNGYESRLLSRSVEDSGTVTSVLIPWNSCGMTQATVLSVPTLTYLPYCFFNILSPFMSILMAAIGYKIFRQAPQNPIERTEC